MLNSKALIVLITVLLILFVDARFAAIVKRATANWARIWRLGILVVLVWLPLLLAVSTVTVYYFASQMGLHTGINQWALTLLMLAYLTKAVPVLVSLAEDLGIGIRYIGRRLRPPRHPSAGTPISRSEFLAKSSLGLAGLPFAGGLFAIGYGTYDFRVIRKTIFLPHLPIAFDGITIGQISDLHLNPGYLKSAFSAGIELLLREKPDMIFFTGDLVNYRTSEAYPYVSLLQKIQAPLGVFSVTGNHDYGDYISWPSAAAKTRNFQELVDLHLEVGHQLLLNAHRVIEQNGERIAVLGVENWGKGRFPKYGDLGAAIAGTDDIPVKVLLSHDPSHWNLQIQPEYPSVDITFSGHTHGFQFGIESEAFRWSPAQYVYDQWAGLYQSNHQYIYVNRGYGSLGFLGRLGIYPELTIINLKRGPAVPTELG